LDHSAVRGGLVVGVCGVRRCARERRLDVNNALLNIIINTSAALIDGPPDIAVRPTSFPQSVALDKLKRSVKFSALVVW
jgi:hypothetical protein